MTAATVYGDLQSACRARLMALSGVPAVAWEGVPFTAPNGANWIREKFSAVDAVTRGVGTGAIVEHIALLVLDLFTPAGHGVKPMHDLAGAVLAHYPVGLPLVYGATAGAVITASRGANYQQESWLRGVITVRVSARTTG